jgi:hypothetical protein
MGKVAIEVTGPCEVLDQPGGALRKQPAMARQASGGWRHEAKFNILRRTLRLAAPDGGDQPPQRQRHFALQAPVCAGSRRLAQESWARGASAGLILLLILLLKLTGAWKAANMAP